MKDRKISKVCEIQKAQPVAEAVLCSLLLEAMGLFRSSTVSFLFHRHLLLTIVKDRELASPLPGSPIALLFLWSLPKSLVNR